MNSADCNRLPENSTIMRVASLIAVIAVVCLSSACSDSPQETDSTSSQRLLISGAGATFPAPLYESWIEHFETTDSNVDFEYERTGSGEGIRRFVAGDVDFGASDAAISADEARRVERGARLIPATAGMVVLAYNIPGVDDGLRLPRDVYVDIFRGDIWRWDDPRIVAANPNLELPSKLIQVVGRRDSSGTTFAFTNHLAAVNEEWRQEPGVGKLIDWPGGAMTSPGNSGVAQRIRITLGSIGYMEYGFAQRLGLPMAILENRAGFFVSPSPASGQQGLALDEREIPTDLRLFVTDPGADNAYPIVSYSWLLLYETYPDPRKPAALKQAISWGLSEEGQSVAEQMGYIPLPNAIADRSLDILRQID